MPGQPYRGKLNERQTTNILNVAARPPAENARRIAGDGQQVVGIRGSGTAALVSFKPCKATSAFDADHLSVRLWLDSQYEHVGCFGASPPHTTFDVQRLLGEDRASCLEHEE